MEYVCFHRCGNDFTLREIGVSSIARLDKPWDDLMLMRTWLSNCFLKHPKCKSTTSKGLPKRLLDVTAFENSENIRLVESQDIATTNDYVTLSYCWGPLANHPPSTRKGNLSDRMQRIRFDNLSLTFKDAVKVCRDLTQRYLWIDSLCIVQDDAADWSEQAMAMASIYGGSYLTLFALSSVDSTQGCRIQPRDTTKPKLSRYQDFGFGAQRVRIFEHWPSYWHLKYGDSPYKHDGYGTNPLRTRAWTLQERELSLRCIHSSQGLLL